MVQTTIYDYFGNEVTHQPPDEPTPLTDTLKLITIYNRLLDDIYTESLHPTNDNIEALVNLDKLISQ